MSASVDTSKTADYVISKRARNFDDGNYDDVRRDNRAAVNSAPNVNPGRDRDGGYRSGGRGGDFQNKGFRSNQPANDWSVDRRGDWGNRGYDNRDRLHDNRRDHYPNQNSNYSNSNNRYGSK